MEKLRVAVLLDSQYTDNYVESFCIWVEQQPALELVAIVGDYSAPAKSSSSLNLRGQARSFSVQDNRELRWLVRVERLLLRLLGQNENLQREIDLSTHRDVKFYCASHYKYELAQQVSSRTLEAMKIDLFIILGTPTHRAEILNKARLGAVTLDYDCPPVGSLAPPGFWETYYKLPVTRFRIRFHPAGCAESLTIFQGSFATKFCFLLNRSHLLGKSIAQLQQSLLNITSEQNLFQPVPVEWQGTTCFSLPNRIEVSRYLTKLVSRVAIKTFRHTFKIRQKWGLSAFRCSWREANAGHGQQILAPDGLFWADPFLYIHEGKTYCFIEEYEYSLKRGRISVLEFYGDKTIMHGVALEEEFHLSFPFLFEYDGSLYMCPESSESRQVRIYRSNDFPLKWELVSIAFENTSMADSMLFYKHNKWWLISSVDRAGLRDHCSELSLYFADSPLGNQWTPHPQNPICVDATVGRNAGLILENGRIFRAAQRQGFDQYGEGLSIFEITLLSESEYVEKLVKSFEAPYPDQADGYHHISTTGEFTVIDRLVRSF